MKRQVEVALAVCWASPWIEALRLRDQIGRREGSERVMQRLHAL